RYLLVASVARQPPRRHPTLEFRVGGLEALRDDEVFDVILLVDVIGHLLDVEAVLRGTRRFCTPSTRIVIAYYNFLWEPILLLAERLGLKMPQQKQNWLSPADIRNLLRLADFEVVKSESRLLLPKQVPLLASIVKRYPAYTPPVNRLCLAPL